MEIIIILILAGLFWRYILKGAVFFVVIGFVLVAVAAHYHQEEVAKIESEQHHLMKRPESDDIKQSQRGG